MAEQKTLFRVSNRQSADSGEPPCIDGDTPGRYYGYFQNAFGEQLVFEYDRESKTARVWHGDAGWERSFLVIDGKAPALVLSEDEQLWLRACWVAAGGH